MVSTAFTVPAQAAPVDPRKEGDRLNDEGRALSRAEKWEEARVKFEGAYARLGSPGVLFNLALAEMHLGQYKVALKHFRIYLALPATDKVTKEGREKGSKFVAECVAKLCTFDVHGATKVTVDGEAPTEVEPGSHKVDMEGLQGAKSKTLTCAAGERVPVEYEEKAVVVAAVPVPSASSAGTTRPPDPPPTERTETGSWLVPGVLAGVGVVGLGVGIGLSAASASANTDAQGMIAQCAPGNSSGCAALREADSKTTTVGTGGIVGYVAGSAFLGAAVVAALVSQPWRERPVSAVRVVPSFGGVAFVGTF